MKVRIKKLFKDLKDTCKKNPVLVFFLAGNFLNGLLLRLFTTGCFGLRAIFMEISFLFLLGVLSLLIKKNRNIYYVVVTIILTIICFANSVYYHYYHSFISVSLLAISVFIKDVGDAVMDLVFKPVDMIYLWVLIGLYFVIKKNKITKECSKENRLSILTISVVCLLIGCTLPSYVAFANLYRLWDRVSVVNNWGVYIYQVDDIVKSLRPSFSNIFGRDKALKDVTNYYDESRRIQSNNEYSNIFKGKNVITIHAESLQTFTMGLSFNQQELTPNLNKLADTGYFYSNFYAQEGVGTSSDSEFTFATGLLPANVGTAFVNYFDNKYVTMQNILKNNGYYVFSMHGNVGSFWNRDVMYDSIGYDKFYSKDSYEQDELFGLGLSDKSFFRQSVPIIKDIKDSLGKPFYGTMITLTNHTPWREVDKFNTFDISIPVVDSTGEVRKNDYLSDKTMGRYLKSVHYMDEAIGEFIQYMDESGLLDDTVIVIYGDHDAKIDKKQYDYLYNYDVVNDRLYDESDSEYKEFNEYDYILNKKVPFIIWSKDIKNPVKVDTPMGMIDVSMTLGNMLGIYNKYSLGRDVMNLTEDESIVVFKDGSYLTNKFYYSSENDLVYALSNSTITKSDLKKYNEYASDIISVSYDIITYDLLRDLE